MSKDRLQKLLKIENAQIEACVEGGYTGMLRQHQIERDRLEYELADLMDAIATRKGV